METLSEKMIDNRLGEPLEKRLQNDPAYREQQKRLSETIREHWEILPRTKKQIKYVTALADIIILMERQHTSLVMRMGYGLAWRRKRQVKGACFHWKI